MEAMPKRKRVLKTVPIVVGLLVLGLGAIAVDTAVSTPAESTITLSALSTPPGTPISSVPYTIKTPGFYYLTNNLSITDANLDAITVESNDVTIDLMGFSLSGPDSGGIGNGIYQSGLYHNIEIRNGTISDFGGVGIYMNSGNPPIAILIVRPASRVMNMQTINNKLGGIVLNSYGNIVRNCTSLGNGYCDDTDCYGIGIAVDESSSVMDCIAHGNHGSGIALGDGCIAMRNITRDNDQRGIWIWGNGCTVIENVSQYNKSGINADGGDSNLIKSNNTSNNIEVNIKINGNYNTIEENSVILAKRGINFSPSSVDNFYANNRALGTNSIMDYSNTTGQIDGGGNN